MLLTDEQIDVLRDDLKQEDDNKPWDGKKRDIGDYAALAGKRFAIANLLLCHLYSLRDRPSNPEGKQE